MRKKYFRSFNFLANFSMCSSPRDKRKSLRRKKSSQQPDILGKAGLLREPDGGASCKQTLPFFSPPCEISVFLDRTPFTVTVPKSQGRLCARWRKAWFVQNYSRPGVGKVPWGAKRSASVPLLRARGYRKVFWPYFSQYFKQSLCWRSSFFIFNVV